jgi:chromosome segregation ATPase
MLDALDLEVKGVGWYGSEPTAEQVTIRQEFIKLNKLVRETNSSLDQRRGEVSDLKSKVSELEEYLDENWDDIDEEVRDKLCEIFGIEAEVTKTIKISVSGTVEITAPRGYDWDNIENDIDLNCETIINNSELTESGYGFSHDDTTVEEY